MGIMNFWKWRKNDITADNTDIAATHAIDVSKEGLRVNNILLTEMTIPALTAAFGEPRIVEPESKEPDASGYIENTVILWDSIGIRAYTKDISACKIDELDLRLLFDEGLKTYDRTIYEPHSDYHGNFTLAGKPALEIIPEKDIKKVYRFFDHLKFGDWEVTIQLSKSLHSKIAAMDANHRRNYQDEVVNIVRNEKEPFSWAYITCHVSKENYTAANDANHVTTHAIDVSKKGLLINNVLMTEMTIPALITAWGNPRIIEPDSKESDSAGHIKNTVLLWDNIGTRVYTKDINAGKILELDIIFLFDKGWKPYDFKVYEPHADYHGSFTLSGKPALEKIPEKELKNAYKYFNDLKFGNWRVNMQLSESLRSKIAAMDFNYRFKHEDEVAALVRSEKQPFSMAYITYQLPRVSTGKYNQIRPDGNILSFDNFNFKLAIVNELMYEQNLIQPKFDVYDFAKDYTKREIDTFEEGDFQPIREAKKWFQELAVSAALAGKVEHLCLDAGNDIYAQLSPHWDGEDDLYDIKAISQKELAQFPNLKHIEIIGFGINKKARTILTTAGIQIND